MRFQKSVPLRSGVAAGFLAAALLLSSCSSDAEESPSPSPTPSSSSSDSGSPSPEITPATNLDGVTVTDADVPEIKLDTPWYIDKTQSKVLREGGKQKVEAASAVTVNYLGVNGRTGEAFDSSYGKAPATFQLSGVVPGFQKGLEGQQVGSRVLIAMPSEDGYATGNPDAGIEVGDTLLFVVDIIAANYTTATGTAVTPKEGLPTVKFVDDKPEITIPDSAAPKELVVQPLIKGDGPKVTATDTIQVKYRSWVWGSGKTFEDGWEVQQGPLAGLIEGWKKGLVGQPAGSRILLVVPPELAYPEGNKSPELEPGQTLVYVIDLLFTVPAS